MNQFMIDISIDKVKGLIRIDEQDVRFILIISSD